MPNKKYQDRNIRKLTRVGKASFAVTIPVEYVGQLKWKEKQKLKVILKGRSLIIRDWR